MGFRGAAPLALLLVVGCGETAHDLTIRETPVVLLRGHVDLAGLTRSNPDVPLLAALIWAYPAKENQVCEKHYALVSEACDDELGVVLRFPPLVAPVDAAGDFELSSFEFAQHDEMMYGSLVVVEDVDRDGELDYPPSLRRQPGVERTYDSHMPVEPIVAATFHSLRERQVRVVWRRRNGGDPPFPEPPACPAPPGLSYVGVGPASGCMSLPISDRIVVPAISPEQNAALACRKEHAERNQATLFSATNRRHSRVPTLGAADRVVCLPDGVLAIIGPSPCPLMWSIALVGCDRDDIDFYCAEPNVRGPKPDWWPCP